METPQGQHKPLDWTDCVGLIVGIMLGTGIFAVFPKLAADHNPSAFLILLTWVLGTGVALCGAFCFAELASLFPHNGGEYVFLKEAYGRGGRGPLAFLFAWAQIFVIRPASLVSLSIILALNASILVRAAGIPLGETALLHGFTYGVLILFAVTAITGLRTSKWVQNAFTALKVACLMVLIGVGLYLGRDKASQLTPFFLPAGATFGGVLKNMGMALIPVMWVFGGWSEAPYIAEDMKNPSRNLPKALVAGVAGLGLLYTLINFVYILHLTPGGLASSWTFSSDIMKMWFGPKGELVMAGTLVISTAGAINGLTVTGYRMADALAADMGRLRRGPEGRASYTGPILFNLALCLVLALLVDCGPDSIDRLLVFTAGVVWIFSALVVSTVFVFRRRIPAAKIPYKLPFYPATPLVFIAMCGYMLYGAWAYKPRETIYGILVIAAGIPAYLLGARAVERARRKKG